MALTKISRSLLDTGISDSSDATAITIDSSENVGLGARLSVGTTTVGGGNTKIVATGGADNYIQLVSNTGNGGVSLGNAGGANLLFYTHTGALGSESFSERMRIDSSGNLMVQTTTQSESALLSLGLAGVGMNKNGLYIGGYSNNAMLRLSSQYDQGAGGVRFDRGGTNVGSITFTSTATSFNTSSDYRRKENVSYDWDATSRLKQLQPARFNFIADETNTLVDGFLAHEVSDIVPEAVNGEKDAVDDEGNPVYQSIDQSKLVPLLVKTIQEQQEQIEALQSEINLLKGE
jgi:hypothetical protein